jgi:hypothetical protein
MWYVVFEEWDKSCDVENDGEAFASNGFLPNILCLFFGWLGNGCFYNIEVSKFLIIVTHMTLCGRRTGEKLIKSSFVIIFTHVLVLIQSFLKRIRPYRLHSYLPKFIQLNPPRFVKMLFAEVQLNLFVLLLSSTLHLEGIKMQLKLDSKLHQY